MSASTSVIFTLIMSRGRGSLCGLMNDLLTSEVLHQPEKYWVSHCTAHDEWSPLTFLTFNNFRFWCRRFSLMEWRSVVWCEEMFWLINIYIYIFTLQSTPELYLYLARHIFLPRAEKNKILKIRNVLWNIPFSIVRIFYCNK